MLQEKQSLPFDYQLNGERVSGLRGLAELLHRGCDMDKLH